MEELMNCRCAAGATAREGRRGWASDGFGRGFSDSVLLAAVSAAAAQVASRRLVLTTPAQVFAPESEMKIHAVRLFPAIRCKHTSGGHCTSLPTMQWPSRNGLIL